MGHASDCPMLCVCGWVSGCVCVHICVQILWEASSLYISLFKGTCTPHTHTLTEPAHIGEVTQNGLDVTPPQPPQEFPSATEPEEVRQDEETFSGVEATEQDSKSTCMS